MKARDLMAPDTDMSPAASERPRLLIVAGPNAPGPSRSRPAPRRMGRCFPCPEVSSNCNSVIGVEHRSVTQLSRQRPAQTSQFPFKTHSIAYFNGSRAPWHAG